MRSSRFAVIALLLMVCAALLIPVSAQTTESTPDINPFGDNADGGNGDNIDGENTDNLDIDPFGDNADGGNGDNIDAANADNLDGGNVDGGNDDLDIEPTPMPIQVEPSGEVLTVYSGRTEDLIAPIIQQFTAETGVQVEVRYGNTSEMAAVILEEGENSPADVFIAQDAGALGALATEGRLSPLASDILARVPAAFRSDEGVWVGLSGRARTLVHTTNLTDDQLPASILDLAQPEWAGRVGWAPTNASFQSQVTAMRLVLGEDATRAWLEAMVANGTVAYDNNRAIVQAVIDGEIEVGLVNHYYLLGFLADDPAVPAANYFFPGGDIGSLINVAGAGVVNTSDTPGLAQRLVLYLLGDNAQEYFAEATYEYPLVEGVESNVALTPLDDIDAPDIDLSNLNDLQATLDLLSTTGALP